MKRIPFLCATPQPYGLTKSGIGKSPIDSGAAHITGKRPARFRIFRLQRFESRSLVCRTCPLITTCSSTPHALHLRP